MIDRLNARKMGMAGNRIRAPPELFVRSDLAHAQHLYRARHRRRGGDHRVLPGRAVRESHGRRQRESADGEFNFAVGEGYLIRNGKIDRPVRGATLIGKGGNTISRIDRVGRRMWMAQGMCGSASGSVPTNVGQPMIRVTDMTVGGR